LDTVMGWLKTCFDQNCSASCLLMCVACANIEAARRQPGVLVYCGTAAICCSSYITSPGCHARHGNDVEFDMVEAVHGVNAGSLLSRCKLLRETVLQRQPVCSHRGCQAGSGATNCALYLLCCSNFPSFRALLCAHINPCRCKQSV
jgi:hypothetical protein